MKKKLSPFLVALLAVGSVIAAELVITSFTPNGALTWTNSVASNATYRVQWAGSADGPWNSFDELTNLNLIAASNHSVTAQVPTFYRVVWLDAPEHAGTWDYSGFGLDGTLVATGHLTLSAGTNPITGTGHFELLEERSGHFGGTQSCTGLVHESGIGLEFCPPNTFDCLKQFHGTIRGNSFTGEWSVGSIGPPEEFGTFEATRRLLND